MELRNKLKGSDKFSELDMRHSFFQFEMDRVLKLYIFRTNKGHYKFNTLAQGVSSASAETHNQIRRIMKAFGYVIHIKDDCLWDGRGK